MRSTDLHRRGAVDDFIGVIAEGAAAAALKARGAASSIDLELEIWRAVRRAFDRELATSDTVVLARGPDVTMLRLKQDARTPIFRIREDLATMA